MAGNQVSSARLQFLEDKIASINIKREQLLTSFSSQGQGETVFKSNSYITSKIIVLLIAIISIIIIINFLIFR